MTPLKCWAALSAHGYIAPICGIAMTRKYLKDTYEDKFGHTLEHAGYMPVRVVITRTVNKPKTLTP